MRVITVKSSTHDYKIILGKNIRYNLDTLLTKEYNTIMIVTDETVADLYLEDVRMQFSGKKLIEKIIPVGETSKSIDVYYEVQTAALEGGLDRDALIIALGGGVVGDLAGFVAATFMRGIDYIQMPTTILAHDSSVGGKVAINHELGKNLIGAFYAPQAVLYDTKTLNTLSVEQVRSGYAELVKEALIADPMFFNSLMSANLDDLSHDDYQKDIEKGIRIKARIVEADEREGGVRKYLNLGHTLGHALESSLGYGQLTHGEAVAIGLLFALYISEKKYNTQMSFNELYDWLLNNKYPISLFDININDLIDHMQRDKKVVNNQVQMILLKEIGQATITEMTNQEIYNYLLSFKEKLVKK